MGDESHFRVYLNRPRDGPATIWVETPHTAIVGSPEDMARVARRILHEFEKWRRTGGRPKARVGV